jgi:DNA-binding transcriptional MerR regulator
MADVESEARATEGAPSYTIDELAAASQVPSRTIRFYQSKGVLPRPDIRGRVAHYGSAHLERLELIASLQDRGLRIEAIRDLCARIDRGDVDVAEWLGLDEQLQHPWADDRPTTLDEEQLYALAGKRRVGLINDLVRHGLAQRQGNVFQIPSPALLQIAVKLEQAGIELGVAVKGGELLRKHLGRTAKELTDLFLAHASSNANTDFAVALKDLRPLALEALRVVFSQEMERQLRDVVESGKSARVSAKKRKPS